MGNLTGGYIDESVQFDDESARKTTGEVQLGGQRFYQVAPSGKRKKVVNARKATVNPRLTHLHFTSSRCLHSFFLRLGRCFDPFAIKFEHY